MTERREGDRRDDTDVTTGEVYRLCQSIEVRLREMQAEQAKESHSLRGYIHSHALLLERHDGDLKRVTEQMSSSRLWVAGICSGTIVGVVIILVQHFVK